VWKEGKSLFASLRFESASNCKFWISTGEGQHAMTAAGINCKREEVRVHACGAKLYFLKRSQSLFFVIGLEATSWGKIKDKKCD
jgi:hypothetical protein